MKLEKIVLVALKIANKIAVCCSFGLIGLINELNNF